MQQRHSFSLPHVKQYLLVYDAQCGLCTKFKRLVDLADRRDRIEYISLEDADRLGLMNSMDQDLAHRSFHLISPSGSITSAPAAIPELCELLPLGGVGCAFIKKVPKAQRVIDFVYTIFSRLHDRGACGYK